MQHGFYGFLRVLLVRFFVLNETEMLPLRIPELISSF